jgi:uncharacterized protein with HEPN domain
MKRNKLNDKIICQHILDSVAFILKYTNGFDEDKFLRDEVL